MVEKLEIIHCHLIWLNLTNKIYGNTQILRRRKVKNSFYVLEKVSYNLIIIIHFSFQGKSHTNDKCYLFLRQCMSIVMKCWLFLLFIVTCLVCIYSASKPRFPPHLHHLHPIPASAEEIPVCKLIDVTVYAKHNRINRITQQNKPRTTACTVDMEQWIYNLNIFLYLISTTSDPHSYVGCH